MSLKQPGSQIRGQAWNCQPKTMFSGIVACLCLLSDVMHKSTLKKQDRKPLQEAKEEEEEEEDII